MLTNAVVAICVELLSNAGVGAVGIPVNEGDAIVARNNISAVFAVILAVLEAIDVVLLVMLVVFDIILVSNPASAFVALVISALILDVFAVISFVLLVILAVFAVMAVVLLVILAVLAAIAAVLLVILAVLALMAVVLLVILAVLEAIKVGKVPIVEELIPPTLLVVVANVVCPLPLTSPVKVIV